MIVRPGGTVLGPGNVTESSPNSGTVTHRCAPWAHLSKICTSMSPHHHRVRFFEDDFLEQPQKLCHPCMGGGGWYSGGHKPMKTQDTMH